MTISELKKGSFFRTLNGNTEYMYIGKVGSEKDGYYYLTARLKSTGKSGFWTTKDIDVIELEEE